MREGKERGGALFFCSGSHFLENTLCSNTRTLLYLHAIMNRNTIEVIAVRANVKNILGYGTAPSHSDGHRGNGSNKHVPGHEESFIEKTHLALTNERFFFLGFAFFVTVDQRVCCHGTVKSRGAGLDPERSIIISSSRVVLQAFFVCMHRTFCPLPRSGFPE